MTPQNCALHFDVTTSIEKWPAQIGALYFHVIKYSEKWPAQIGALYFDVNT